MLLMPQERKYKRENALTTDGYYRQKLSNMEDRDGYENKETSQLLKYGIATAGLAITGGSAKILYENGDGRAYIHRLIMDLASSGITDYASVKEVLDESVNGKNMLVASIDLAKNHTIQNAFEKSKLQRLKNAETVMKDLETIRYIRERYSLLKKIESSDINARAFDTIRATTASTIKELTGLDPSDELDLLRKNGFRHATIGDLIHLGKINADDVGLIESLKREIPDIMKLKVDSNVLIDNYGKVADTRDFVKSLKKMGSSLVNDYQIPILGISPLKMFHVDEMLGLNDYKTPIFSLIKDTDIQPGISYRVDELGRNYVQSGRKILDTITGQTVHDNMTQVHVKSTWGRMMRRMSGVGEVDVRPKSDNRFIKTLAKIAEEADFGMQSEVYTQNFDILTPGTWIPSISQKIVSTVSPVIVSPKTDTMDAFGKNTKTVFVPGSKTLKDGVGEFFGQFSAGRKNFDKVTRSSLVPYMLIERINASLQAFGLGLGSNSIGSASDTFVNLLGKRVVPIAVGIGALKYIDYLFEKKDGQSPKDAIVQTTAIADINMAAIREKTGVNKKLERLKELSPGIQFIEELPGIGKLLDTKNKEEAEEYWEKGNKAVRKGRWWSLGSTPYTGGRVEYYRPNTKRLVESDWEFTDAKYGSKKEYYDNLWLPTPTSPFAPIKHFLTDPYHYENKHYKDRPYAMSGGINEFREIPIVGGFMDATIGRILKPRRKMHEEYWDGERLIEKNDVIKPPYSSLSSPSFGVTGSTGENNIPVDKQDEYRNVLYTTASGKTDVYAVSNDYSLGHLNNLLKEASIKSTGASSVKAGGVKYGDMASETIIPLKPNGILNAVEDMWYDVTEIGGFYGFTGASVLGEGIVQKPRVQSANDMMSYSDSFWEKSLGGFGGELSEIFRRFLPNKRYAEKQLEINPIRNTMPTWMPGREYFTDFLHGDPYNKVKEGEYRLPGAGYEALHNIEDPTKFRIGSSSVGKNVTDLVKHYLQVDDIEMADNERLQDIVDLGNDYHTNMEKYWENIGVSVASEVYVKDEEMNIEGWIDAVLKDPTSKSGYAISDIKTINQRGFDNAKKGIGKQENISQLQWYLHMTGQDVGYLHYINRDNKKDDPVTIRYNYDPSIVEESYKNLTEARGAITKMMDAGVVQRGDLYKPIDRYRILADVAPYSDNFRYYDKLLSKMSLRPEEEKEVDAIRKQVQSVKEKMRLTPYKFKTANLDYETVTVKKVLDDGKILTEEYDSNPLKLAGIDFRTGESTEEGVRNIQYLRDTLKEGSKINIGYDADPLKKVNDDTYKTISVVATKGDRNINKEMLKKGYAEEKENDESPASIHARYSRGEITYGKIFESIAHLDTYANTKFLQGRSALEMYKRNDVYGKDWREWTSPVDDFLIPTIDNISSKGVFVGTLGGILVGSLFGKKGTSGRMMGAAIGGASMFVLSTYNKIKEEVTGEKPIPKRRKKERELNEYMDTLKYVKNMRLFGQYRELAIKRENVDPLEIIEKRKEQGEWKEKRSKELERVKRKIKTENISLEEAKEITKNEDATSLEDVEKSINKQLSAIKNFRSADAITPLAAQAVMYYNESEKTSYGYDAGEPIQNILSALNRKERKYLMPFIEAPEEEREEILKVAPSYMKRALQSTYGLKVDDKKPLDEYFKDHFLPDEDWAGWRPDVDLEDVKVKLVRHEGMDASEFDIWTDDEVRASSLDIPIPKINFQQRATSVQQKLYDVLKNSGLEDIQVSVNVSDKDGIDMDFDVTEDRRRDIENYVNNNGIF